MTILQISILAVVALVLGRLPKFRQLALLAVSAFVVFWLQPAEPFVSFAFWLPVATLTITVLAWALTSTPEMRAWKQNWPAITILVGIVLLMDLNHYFKLTQVYISTTPSLTLTLIALTVISAAALFINAMAKVSSNFAGLGIYCNHFDFYLFENSSIDQLRHRFSFRCARAKSGHSQWYRV